MEEILRRHFGWCCLECVVCNCQTPIQDDPPNCRCGANNYDFSHWMTGCRCARTGGPNSEKPPFT